MDPSGKSHQYKKDSYLYLEGDPDNEKVYIIDSGKVKLTSSEGRIKKHKTILSSGDIFGFIGSLSKRPRLETAQVIEDAMVIPFTREQFLNLLQKNSDIAMKIINYFADELRVYDEMIFVIQNLSAAEGYGVLNEDDELFRLASFHLREQRPITAFYIANRYLQLYPSGNHREEISLMMADLKKNGLDTIPEPLVDGINKIYQKDMIIFCEGEPGEELYIIKEGKVKISKQNNDSDVTLSILKPGDIFGELAIVSNKNRNASAMAFETTTLLPITSKSLMKLLEQSPDILKRIFTAISNRVWFTYVRLEAALYIKPVTRLYAFIESKLLENRISANVTTSVSLNHGIDELLSMAGLNHEKHKNAVNTLVEDKNFSFNFGQIVINNPSEVIHRSHYFKKRDRLDD